MLIVGCGYIGTRVAQRLQGQGEPVSGVVSLVQSAEQLGEQGIPVVRCDLDTEQLPAGSTEGQQVFYFAPPPPSGLEAVGGDGRIFLEWDIPTESEDVDTQGFTFFCEPIGTVISRYDWIMSTAEPFLFLRP